MPFTPTADLPPNPSVRIFFIGQLILEPSRDKKTCEVFINRSAPDHHLSIEVRRKRPKLPDVIVMRHLGPLSFIGTSDVAPKHGMFITVSNSAEDVKRYNGGNSSPEGKKLDHALNLKEIHDVPTGKVDPSGGRPSILLDNAVFYTADMTPDDLTITLQKKTANSTPEEIQPIASIIGANIYLKEESVVSLNWRQLGREVSLDLDFRNAEEGATYEIYISNDPLYDDDGLDKPFKHDEFAEYYRILPDLPSNERFQLDFPEEDPDAPRGDRGSGRVPCMAVLLNDGDS
ncbi:MAG TPA: hypothetical protein VM095_03700 [Pyrinomonadaceae bacterium]|nr:hypothetical protein [Pyrinomonadaceae bacterium]